MKKDFEQIRLEMYEIIYSFQKDLDEGRDITQTGLLDMFVDGIAGIYDMLQYYFDKIIRVVNPAVVLYHKEGLFPEFSYLLKLFRYKELDNYEKALTPLKEYREFLMGTILEAGLNADHSEYLMHFFHDIDLSTFDRTQLIRALVEAWMYVLQQLDYYYERILDEISIEGDSAGNASGFAELFGFPLHQKLPFAANAILYKKTLTELPKNANMTLSDDNWVTTEPITFNGYKGIAFSEQVISVREDKKAIIVKRTCTNRVGDLILLVGKGWQRYAIITNIIKTYLYAEYEIEYKGILSTDPEYCIRVTTLEQREEIKLNLQTNGFTNQLVKLKDVAFLPDKGIKNKLFTIKVNDVELEYKHSIKEFIVSNDALGYYTYRLGDKGDCYIIIGGKYDFNEDLEITYWKSTVNSIEKGRIPTADVDVVFLDDIEEDSEDLRLFHYNYGRFELIPKELLVKRFIGSGLNQTLDYFKDMEYKTYHLSNILNMQKRVKLKDIPEPNGVEFVIESEAPLTYYQRKNILALYLIIYDRRKTFLWQEL